MIKDTVLFEDGMNQRETLPACPINDSESRLIYIYIYYKSVLVILTRLIR